MGEEMNNETLYVSVGDKLLQPAAKSDIDVIPLAEPITLPIESHCPVLTDEQLRLGAEEHCQPGYSGLRSQCEITIEGGYDGNPIFLPHKRYPRRLKKAIGQICSIRVSRDRVDGCISLKQRTKWQRKAMSMVQQTDGYLTVPMVNGMTMTVKY